MKDLFPPFFRVNIRSWKWQTPNRAHRKKINYLWEKKREREREDNDEAFWTLNKGCSLSSILI